MTPLWLLASLFAKHIVSNVAALPPPRPSTSYVSSISALVSTSPPNNNTLDEKFSCFPAGPQSRPISWATCTPILTWILRFPDAYEKHIYKGSALQPIYLSPPPCQIILGTRISAGTAIKISKQEIVSYARNLLDACRSRNAGGIWHVSEKWYIAIKGGVPDAAQVPGVVAKQKHDLDQGGRSRGYRNIE